MTPTWRIETGDCLELMKSLRDGEVDAVVTDPPYGIAGVWKGGFGSGWGKAREQTQHRNAWDEKAPSQCVFDKILSFKVKTAIWGGNYFSLPMSRGWLVWNKPERNFSLAEAELAWTNVDTVIRVIDYRRSDNGREHPTQKPLGVMSWCLEQLRIPIGATVLDPFCGSGTTGVACIQTGRNFIGYELDPGYAEIARRRCREAAEAQALFVPPVEVKRAEEEALF